MSKRKLYGCCRHRPSKYSYIGKFYKAPEDQTALVKIVEDFIRAEYFDDGMDVVRRRREPWDHELANSASVSYSLNKRNRWRLVEELPSIVPQVLFDEPPLRTARSKKGGTTEYSVTVRGTIGTCPLYQYFSGIPYLKRYHPVTFSNCVTSETSNTKLLPGKKNWSKKGRRKEERTDKSNQEVADDRCVIGYCIGVPPEKTSYVFRKDRHTSDRDYSQLEYHLRKNSPSSGYKYKEEVDEYHMMGLEQLWELPIEGSDEVEEDTARLNEVSVYNMEDLLLAGRARQEQLTKRKAGKFPLDYEVIQDMAESSAWEEVGDLGGEGIDTGSVTSGDSSWELISSGCDGFEDV
ncbi:hypothetical protein RvY_18580 [Ramazzottius varieornatus]|uniref:Uncharacterized protein n=1 Tax=Ramazzottius varieornatus TaxID=947166 RepID=A0A1D1WAM9_RAMVA|nr:hypothetical protein RvY_18580 [Ramazzottius varieornatus]